MAASEERLRAYAWYALVVLTLASIFNFADRQIVSIPAQSMKADLGLTDPQLGFLLGTVFAVLYAVIGFRPGLRDRRRRRARAEAYGEPKYSA